MTKEKRTYRAEHINVGCDLFKI